MNATKQTAFTSVSLAALLGLGLLAASPVFAKDEKAAQAQEMREADKPMGQVLKELQKLGVKPVAKLSVEEARKQPTPADAVKAVLKAEGKDPVALMAAMKVSKKDMTFPTGGGTQPVRIYTPETTGSGPLPVIVYWHGGGFVIADIETYEASAMALAHKTGAIVVSAEYRHAPEAKFPAQGEDAIAAYKWVIENGGQFNADTKRVAVAGESAGGNLAINVAIAARDMKLQAPLHMLLVYPVAGVDTETPSYREHKMTAPLSSADLLWYFDKTLNGPQDKQDPRLDVIGKADLKGLPSATVINAEIDPLASDGKLLSEKLKKAGVEVTHKTYEGVTHEFFGMAPLVPDAEKAQTLAAKELKEAFSGASSTGSTGARKKSED
ncbi:alpha/beta hydrolase [Methylobacterium sp. E-016]|uniref:alpha/beta hydrolase n=1 Tax=unclassified Methylobacterium TaxID=2615210 RepID=UPI001AEE9EF2|nr:MULTISPECIES: alpha/beta hydrolase [unclassified Methylobacterium]MCJ2075272.1 alpha/beta hydrolase [Methylobacterium sp. E-016]